MSNEVSNSNETVEQVCESVEYLCGTDGGGLEIFGEHINPISLAERILAAHNREVAELRKCLNEAIREKCPFTRMSCKKGEPCDYECGTDKWRKALGE